jgi:peroxiredoxin
LGRAHDDLAARGTRVLAIGKGTTRSAARVASMLKLPFPLLADPSGDAYARFGFGKSLLVIQQSGTVLIDRDGLVRYVRRGANPGDALDMYELTEAVKELNNA